jgi:hypothetical protein
MVLVIQKAGDFPFVEKKTRAHHKCQAPQIILLGTLACQCSRQIQPNPSDLKQRNMGKFLIVYKKTSTSLLAIGLKFYSLLIIMLLKLENKCHFCPWQHFSV